VSCNSAIAAVKVCLMFALVCMADYAGNVWERRVLTTAGEVMPAAAAGAVTIVKSAACCLQRSGACAYVQDLAR
jgi:hypothetical protein